MGTIYSLAIEYVYGKAGNESSPRTEEQTTPHPSTLDSVAVIEDKSGQDVSGRDSPQVLKNDIDEQSTADKINLVVRYSGKFLSVDIFPLERIRTLLENVCEEVGKNPDKMQLVCEDILDELKTVKDYKLRGGQTVSLIHK